MLSDKKRPVKRGTTSIKAASLTHTGLVRKNNEDACFMDIEQGIFIVADGMGGHAAGETASSLMVEQASEYLINNYRPSSEKKILQTAIEKGNLQIINEAERHPEKVGMGTTVVIALIKKRTAHIAWAGDTRAYLYRDSNLLRLTKDHSTVQMLVDAGQITEDEAVNHPRRNEITVAAGLVKDVPSDYIKTAVKKNDIIILATDGVFDGLKDIELSLYIDSDLEPDKAAEKLIKQANERGGADNSTVVYVKI